MILNVNHHTHDHLGSSDENGATEATLNLAPHVAVFVSAASFIEVLTRRYAESSVFETELEVVIVVGVEGEHVGAFEEVRHRATGRC
jgi:hypothetical protein